jgi:hypothetical protein
MADGYARWSMAMANGGGVENEKADGYEPIGL